MKFSKLPKHQVSCTLFSVTDCVRSGETGRHSETTKVGTLIVATNYLQQFLQNRKINVESRGRISFVPVSTVCPLLRRC